MVSGLSIFTLFFFTPILFKVGSILFLTFSFKLIEDKLNLSQYDYILIDTHPDFRTTARNTVVVNDKIISSDISGANNDENKRNTIESIHNASMRLLILFQWSLMLQLNYI